MSEASVDVIFEVPEGREKDLNRVLYTLGWDREGDGFIRHFGKDLASWSHFQEQIDVLRRVLLIVNINMKVTATRWSP